MWLILLLFFLSGLSGLIYEVVWMKFLAQMLGLSAYAVSCVLTAFMAGLALGSFIFGRWIDKGKKNPILVYAFLELGIGIWALAMPYLVKWLMGPYIFSYQYLAGSPSLMNLMRFALAALILIPPTTLMGATFPVLSKYMTRDKSSVGFDVGTLYAINTFGATTGCLLAGFYLIGQLGLLGTNALAAAVNFGVATLAFKIRDGSGANRESVPRRQNLGTGSALAAEPSLILFAFALSGFAALGYEVAWARTLIFFLDNSTWAFTTMLATFLFGIAFGSHLFKKYADKTPDPVGAFSKIQLAIGIFALFSIPIMWKLFTWEPIWGLFKNFNIPWQARIALTVSACSAVMLVPTLFMGAAFPVVSRIVGRRLDILGQEIGDIYSINTLGAIFGAFLTGFFILPLAGLQKTIFLLALVNITMGTVLVPIWKVSPHRDRFRFGSGTVPIIFAVAVGYFVFANSLTFKGDTELKTDATLFYKEGIAATVKVWQRQDGTKAISVDGHEIGSNAPTLDEKQKLLAHLPLLLIDEPKSALVVGVGSGITLGAIASWDELEKIDAIEIVPAVVDAARLFEKENKNALKDARVKVHAEDGINFLLASKDKYDLISSDAKLNPTFVGNASLYSEEYLRLCLEHLTDKGIMCEWIPLYLPPDMYKMILRTFIKVFPHASIWVTSRGTTILMGYKNRIGTVPLLKKGDSPYSDLSPFNLDNADYLLSAFQGDEISIRAAIRSGPTNSLQRPYIEFKGPMQFMRTFTNQNEAENLQLLIKIGDTFRFGSRTVPALLLEGLALAKQSGLYIRGSEYFKKAYSIAPKDRRVKYYFDLIEDEAASAERKAFLNPSNVEARHKLGMIRLEEKRFDEAIREFQAAVTLNPKNAGAYNNLGIAYHLSGNLNEAIAAYQKALVLDPSNEGIRRNLEKASKSQ